MFADWYAPLNAFAGPFSRDFEQAFGKAYARRGQRESPGVQRRKRDFQSGAFLENDVLTWDTNIREFYDRVIQCPQPHEPASISDLQPWRIHINDERCDLLALFAAHHF